MASKVLICASTTSHINNFHLPYLNFFKDQGFEVHVAVPGKELQQDVDFLHNIPITKNILSINNLLAIMELRDVFKANNFEIMLTHTTLAGFIARLALLLAGKRNTKVINTVHGYLFWNGCGTVKKLIYYLPEYFLRNITDCIITMNDEDTITANKLVNRSGFVEQVPGMGVDSKRFSVASESEKILARQKLSINDDAFVIVYAAEFSKRKNHIELIQAMSQIVTNVPDAILLLCGTGEMQEEITAEVKRRSLNDNVRFMGWCKDMEDIYRACDIAVSTSKSEGLPFNIIEAQLCNLPVVASKIRGHIDLIQDGENGWLYSPGNPKELSRKVLNIINSPDRGNKQGKAAGGSAVKYSLPYAYPANIKIYKKFIARDDMNTI